MACLYRHIRLTRLSISSDNRHRSKATFNCPVHTRLLEALTSVFPFLQVEPITAAQILIVCHSNSRPRGSMSSQPSVLPGTRDILGKGFSERLPGTNTVRSEVHNMVDFAVTLSPEKELRDPTEEIFAI